MAADWQFQVERYICVIKKIFILYYRLNGMYSWRKTFNNVITRTVIYNATCYEMFQLPWLHRSHSGQCLSKIIPFMASVAVQTVVLTHKEIGSHNLVMAGHITPEYRHIRSEAGRSNWRRTSPRNQPGCGTHTYVHLQKLKSSTIISWYMIFVSWV